MTRSSGRAPARARLAELMDRRRRDLRLTWDAVAAHAGIHRETLRQIRAGSGDIRPLTADGIEDALGWEHGSIDAVLAGGEPTVAAAAALPERAPVLAERHVSWDELLELIEDARDNDDQLVYDALVAVKRLREARNAPPSGRPADKRSDQAS